MLHIVASVFAVVGLGSLITIGVVQAAQTDPTDARGNPLWIIDPQEVERQADEPSVFALTHMTSL